MQKNMGLADRVLRALIGAVLLILAFPAGVIAAGALQWIVAIVGVVMLLTALVGVCPAYMPFGIRTCPRKG